MEECKYMEKWQRKIVKEIYEVNFKKDIKIIKKAFKELCQPMLDLKNYNYNKECKYREAKETEDDILSFEVGNYAYQLIISNTSLILFSGNKSGKYMNNIPAINTVCRVEYSILDEQIEKKQVYEVNIEYEEKYELISNCNLNEIKEKIKDGPSDFKFNEKENRFISEQAYYTFVFDEDIYKIIINNMMNLAVVGSFEIEFIPENLLMYDGPVINPFEV